jgi:hypothetical protein
MNETRNETNRAPDTCVIYYPWDHSLMLVALVRNTAGRLARFPARPALSPFQFHPYPARRLAASVSINSGLHPG